MEILQIDITMHVPSLEKTMQWYAEILGWKSCCDLRNDAGECVYGDVYYSHDPVLAFNLLKSDETGGPSGFHPLIKVPDVDALYADLQHKDVDIIHPPREQPWGKNLHIRDLNGYMLEFWQALPASTPADVENEIVSAS